MEEGMKMCDPYHSLKLKFFCPNDSTLMCTECALEHSSHLHQIKSLNSIFTQKLSDYLNLKEGMDLLSYLQPDLDQLKIIITSKLGNAYDQFLGRLKEYKPTWVQETYSNIVKDIPKLPNFEVLLREIETEYERLATYTKRNTFVFEGLENKLNTTSDEQVSKFTLVSESYNQLLKFQTKELQTNFQYKIFEENFTFQFKNSEEVSAPLTSVSAYLGYYESKQIHIQNMINSRREIIAVDSELLSPSMIIVKEKIYLIGDEKPTKSTYEVDILTKKVSKKGDMKYSKSFTHLINQHEFIYSIGMIAEGEAGKQCERYDIKRDKWTQIPSLNTSKYLVGGCLFNDIYIYIFGGRTQEGNTKEVEYLNTQLLHTSGWEQVLIDDKSMWAPRRQSACVQIDQHSILVFGSNYPLSKNSFLFTPFDAMFKKVADLQDTAKFNTDHSNGCLKRMGKVYAIDRANKLHIYSILADQWQISHFD